MRPRRVILVSIVALLFGAACYLLFAPARQPYYKGKPYTFWLEQQQASYTFQPGALGARFYDIRDLQNATLEADTNAIPYLLRWIAYEPSPWAEKLRYRYNRFKARNAPPGTTPTNLWNNKKIIRAARTPEAFRVLGRKAEPAISELARLAANPNTNIAMRAIRALSYVGPNGLPPVLGIITNRAPCYDYAIVQLRQFGGYARPAVPVLIQCLSDTNLAVVDQAAQALGQMQFDDAVVVPALAQTLKHPSPQGRMSIIQVLRWFGYRAQPAAAALRNAALNDPDLGIRVSATNALRQLGFKLQEEPRAAKKDP